MTRTRRKTRIGRSKSQRSSSFEKLQSRLLFTADIGFVALSEAPLFDAEIRTCVVPLPAISQAKPKTIEERLDVNRDGTVTPLDVLSIINFLNENDKPPAWAEFEELYDLDESGEVSALDAQLLADYLDPQFNPLWDKAIMSYLDNAFLE